MKFETLNITGWEGAILGLRLPMCSNWKEAKEKSDSDFNEDFPFPRIGPKDLDLMKRLVKADSGKGGYGQPNAKYLRMIHVQAVVTAPAYWWTQADTYKVSTVTLSTSKMHTLYKNPIMSECFEADPEDALPEITEPNFVWEEWLLPTLEDLRQKYNETKNKAYWDKLLKMLPESWLQQRIWDLDYATIRMMYQQRKNHKLKEWNTDFVNWVKSLYLAPVLLTEE